VPRRHASSSATRCTADVPTPAAALTSSRSATARAPGSPPIFARAVTASHCGAPSPVRASAASGATARPSLSNPNANAAAACTAALESRSAAMSGATAAVSPRRQLAHPAAHPHQIVVARRGAEANVDLGHREVHALLLQLFVGDAGLAHQLGAGAVEPDQVVGVVDHAHLIGLRVVDAER